MPKRGRVAVPSEKPASTPPAKERVRVRAAPPPARVKVVWEICSGSGKVLKTYPYNEKAIAEAATKALTRSSGRAHMVRATKVPME